MIQHLVSRGLLRRFAHHRRGPIACLDLDSLIQRIDKVENLGCVEDADMDAPNAVENVWNNEVESRLPYAFQLLDEGKLLSNPTAITTLKNCIALHFARGFAAKEVTEKILIPHTTQEAMDAVLERFTPIQALYALTGSADSSSTKLLYEAIRKEFTEKLRVERFMDDAFLDLYRKGQSFLETKSLEIWHSQDKDFLLGDIPVVTHEKSTGKVGVLDDVSWDKSDILFMPLGPYHVVAVSNIPAYKETDNRMVERLNVYQVRAALKEVYFHPNSNLGSIIVDALANNRANPRL